MVEIVFGAPLPVDPYTENRATGGFVLIDADTNLTVGACMIESALENLGAERGFFAKLVAASVTAPNVQSAEALRSLLRECGLVAVIIEPEFDAVASALVAQDVFVILLNRNLELSPDFAEGWALETMKTWRRQAEQ